MQTLGASITAPTPSGGGDRTSGDGHSGGHKKPKKAADKTGTAPPSRFSLRMGAGWWRSLQTIGMSLHFLAPPWPPSPVFTRTIPSTLATEGSGGRKKGCTFDLVFYVPEAYKKQREEEKEHHHKGKNKDGSEAAPSPRRWPAVVNFHGGGFTLGAATDDARFARFVVEECDAVFVSVAYRLAPEHPFPTAVDDGADALLYLMRHADELYLDQARLGTSGFSAGGNIALTAPLRLEQYRAKTAADRQEEEGEVPQEHHKLVAIAAFYPITDFTRSRAGRRAASARPELTLPSTLTDLFDASYLHPPDLNLAQPLLSPSRAADDLLRAGLPDDVILYTCEWDMLQREGEELARRLGGDGIGKTGVFHRMIPGVRHGWDKGPKPISPPEGAEAVYEECCGRLMEVFERAR